MRQSTRTKLFLPNERVKFIADFSDHVGNKITQVIVNNVLILVTEFPDEKDGFDVYVRTPGNSINGARKAIGLPTLKI